MLKAITLLDWKSFGPEDSLGRVPMDHVSLLVGPNGSGKSNVLDALRFLQGAALDLPLGDVLRGRWEAQREVWPSIRGHTAEAARAGCSSFTLKTEWEIDGTTIRHSITVNTSAEVVIDWESLEDDEGYLFDTNAPALKTAGGRSNEGLRVALRGQGKGNSPTTTYSSHKSLLGQVEVKNRVSPVVATRAAQIRAALRNVVFLDIRPATMRDYRPENGGQLGASGENISPVLYALKAQDPSKLEDVVDWLSELSAPEVTAIDFDRTQLREIMFFLLERGGRRISARSLSDGTLRFLGELVAMMTCPEGSLVVLEEPDVGLHPSRIQLLAALFEGIAERRQAQVLATTHSPTLLAHLSEKALGAVVAFGRAPESGFTVCRQIKTLPNFETLRDATDLAHLVSTGWLERAL